VSYKKYRQLFSLGKRVGKGFEISSFMAAVVRGSKDKA
jgi:hypothetical protein